jgi:hypothetical protein
MSQHDRSANNPNPRVSEISLILSVVLAIPRRRLKTRSDAILPAR